MAVGVLLLAGCGGLAPRSQTLEKSIWVSRNEYRTQADIERIMQRSAATGFRTVIFQVRGNGTTFFASRLEPWSEKYGFQSPGFDPLSQAVVAAHANGLEIHAWINAFPGWAGDAPPADRRQLFHTRPEWFLRTRRGKLVKDGRYAFLNPCLPAVREHVARLCEEIVTGYQVDGLHLDYIRFPFGPASEESPGDPRSLAMFQRQTGRPVSDRAAFRKWKTDCVTELVRRVRYRMSRLPRRVLLTVAVNPDMQRIRKGLLQDWPRWARERLVDAVFPMNYTHDLSIFQARSRACVAAAAGTHVVMGVGSYMHEKLGAGATLRQMDAAVRAGASGVCLFSYGSATRGEWQPALARWNRRR